jgi:hypothetical protein
MKALILENKVVDLAEKEFEVSKSFSWVDCDSTVKHGDFYENGRFERKFPYSAIESLRMERNARLMESDINMMISNETNTKIDEWKQYRQALRDLPSKASPTLDENGVLTNVTWPTKPN